MINMETSEAMNERGVRARTPNAVPIGIKVGSQRTVLAKMGNSGALEVNTVFSCLKNYRNSLTNEIESLYGEDATAVYGDEVEYMLRAGLPDTERDADLLKQFLDYILEVNNVPENSFITFSVPGVEGGEGLGKFKEIVESLDIGRGGKQIWSDSFCGAVPLYESLGGMYKTFLTINGGSSTLEVTAFRNGEVVHSTMSAMISGDGVDREIRLGVERDTRGSVYINNNHAREYKESYGSVNEVEPLEQDIQLHRKGKYTYSMSGIIRDALRDYAVQVAEYVTLNFLPQLAEKNFQVYKGVMSEPFVLMGGMSAIDGMRDMTELLIRETLGNEGVSIAMHDMPQFASAIGAYSISELSAKVG